MTPTSIPQQAPIQRNNYLADKYGITVPTLINMTASATQVSEAGGTTVTLSATRTKFSASPLTVLISQSGSATAGSDFIALPSSITIPAFSTSGSVVMTLIDDSLEEFPETVTVTALSSSQYALGGSPSATIAILDNENHTPPSNQFAWYRADLGITQASGLVSNWANQISAAIPATQTSGTKKPSIAAGVLGGKDALLFNGVREFNIANDTNINSAGPYYAKSFALVIRTGSDVTTRQLIWEQGGASRGLNFYIHNGSLCFGAYNCLNDGVNTPWNPSGVCGAVSANSNYFGFYELDGTGLTLSGKQNGVSLGQSLAGPLYGHTGTIGFGAIIATTVYLDGTIVAAGEGFQGHLAEFMMFSGLLNSIQEDDLHSYIERRYGFIFP